MYAGILIEMADAFFSPSWWSYNQTVVQDLPLAITIPRTLGGYNHCRAGSASGGVGDF